jgi:hypothetical protein
MKTRIKYVCEICNREYLTEKEAIRCENFGTEIPLFKIGDYVISEKFPSKVFIIKEEPRISHDIEYTANSFYIRYTSKQKLCLVYHENYCYIRQVDMKLTKFDKENDTIFLY